MTIRVLSSNDGQVLANTIADANIDISNVTYNGADVASGTFTNGEAAGIGIDEGIILTTGNVNNAIGNTFFNADNGFTGSADLNAALGSLIPGNSGINNAASLKFDFETDGTDVSFDLVFATNEFDFTDFDDVFGLFLNGENIAFIPGTNTPISVTDVENTPGFTNANSGDLGYDDFTNVFTVELTDLQPGTNTLEFAIADEQDDVVDSAIFIAGDVTVENQPLNPVIGSPNVIEVFGTDRNEEFIGSDGNDGITGNDLDNTILGRSGIDVIDGQAGDDFIDGGGDADTVVYQFDVAGVTVDLSAGSATDGFGDSDVLIDIENIIGSEFNDRLIGGDDANSLAGRDGDDNIAGRSGDDFLIGAAGSDTLSGGAGNDSFVFVTPAEGNDTITDFELGIDEITIVSDAFGGGLSAGSLSTTQFTIGSSATNSNQRFIFDDATGDLFFDRDGNGSQGQQLIANVGAGIGFSSSDIELL